MIYRMREYDIQPHRFSDFNYLFYHFLLPNQKKHGAILIGRFINEDKTKIIAIWEYKNIEHYYEIEQKIIQTELHEKAQAFKSSIPPLYIRTQQTFWDNTNKFI
ncbi:NIPSNAP family protein [Macrococcus sp. EM39E]|uniref:NIPSNAP family protein n=1 Tax=Macrococcus animalis TaxID=3395467 RepID=UPI0039BDD4E3